MTITILTIFPDMFEDFKKEPVIARAIARKALRLHIVDIRTFAGGSFRHIDDDTYGGGAGMIMRAQPVLDALSSVRGQADGASKPPCRTLEDQPAEQGDGAESSRAILLSPSGHLYDQRMAHAFSELRHLILICGHYEGIDARVESHVDDVLSIGDYVLTGGELSARVICDSVVRLLPGVLRARSTEDESFEGGLLEYPQYTKPVSIGGQDIPEVLLTGDHEKIRLWRKKESLRRTMKYRPDLLASRHLTEEEQRLLGEIRRETGL